MPIRSQMFKLLIILNIYTLNYLYILFLSKQISFNSFFSFFFFFLKDNLNDNQQGKTELKGMCTLTFFKFKRRNKIKRENNNYAFKRNK